MFKSIHNWLRMPLSKIAVKHRRTILSFEGLEDRLTPAAFLVNSLDDAPPPPPPPGTPGPTFLILRDAIALANASPDPASSISFAPGLGGTIMLGSALPAITCDLSITGNTSLGANNITVERDVNQAFFGIFALMGAVEFSLSYLNVARGNSLSVGGGLSVPAGAIANLYQVNISSCTAANTGGGISNSGTVTLENSAIFLNAADRGGGVFNQGTLYVQWSSSIYGNTAQMHGGGIFNTGTCVISDSHVDYNRALGGAGGGRAGGIYNGRSLQMSNSTLTNNAALRSGGGLYCEALSTTNLTAVTISNNSVNNAAGDGKGGGFYVEVTATLSASNCTLTNNFADHALSRGGYVEAPANYSWAGPLPEDPVFREPT